jgi:hypothetical protein
MTIVEELLNNIYDISSLMPRISAVAPSTPAPVVAPTQQSDDASGEDLENAAGQIEAESRRLRQIELENETYLGEMKRDSNLDGLKVEILEKVAAIQEECISYREGYDQYIYLWTVSFYSNLFLY